MKRSRVLVGSIAAFTMLASVSCGGTSRGAPDHCPRGKVVAHAQTLPELRTVMLRQQAHRGAVRVVQYDVNRDVRVFAVEDKRGRRMYYLNVWTTESGEWVYSRQVTCL